jgi:uncharacterized membrane protein (UPF0127 family)
MKKRVVVLKSRGKRIKVEVFVCSFFMKLWGLMFSRGERARNLIFEFNEDVHLGIHSFFVFNDFLAVFVDSKYNVIEVKWVRPFCSYVNCKVKYRYLIEVPVNKRNMRLLKNFV